ncbi:DUF6264 family protein [Curtobacterium sp. ISL-83]|uniref:DUF6264 family protein n=1 Tax=Curtobacterium sp. ISL-83 TaxID=2819145 RepID=UPI001BE56ED4|nr:DUF6264 family protein [Curtobacterium sp. ISL-83]MBT2501385.1 hypothetical protein [Curtobacterium sp. ISL-83]
MSDEASERSDGWGSVPPNGSAHVADTVSGREALADSPTSATGDRNGRVHGRPAPQYGEYAPEGWVNPVLVEQERLAQEQRSRALREQAATEAAEGFARSRAQSRARSGVRSADRSQTGHESTASRSSDGAGADAGATPHPFGASSLDFAVTVGLLAMGLWSVLQALAVGMVASTTRAYVAQHYTALADPAGLSPAAVVRAVVMVLAFALVMWWSIRRLRSRRWTFWVPLVGGVVASILGAVPLAIVILHDPHVASYLPGAVGG